MKECLHYSKCMLHEVVVVVVSMYWYPILLLDLLKFLYLVTPFPPWNQKPASQ